MHGASGIRFVWDRKWVCIRDRERAIKREKRTTHNIAQLAIENIDDSNIHSRDHHINDDSVGWETERTFKYHVLRYKGINI